MPLKFPRSLRVPLSLVVISVMKCTTGDAKGVGVPEGAEEEDEAVPDMTILVIII